MSYTHKKGIFMNSVKSIPIEKLLILKTFFLLLSLALFVDTLLIVFSDITFREIGFSLLKDNIGNSLVILLLYTFFMSVLVKNIIYFVGQIYMHMPDFLNYYKYSRDNDLHYNFKLRNIAIKHNNAVLYQFYETRENISENIRTLKYLSVSILMLFVFNYFISNETQVSLMCLYVNFAIENEKTWYYFVFNLICILSVITILFGAIGNKKYVNKSYLDISILDFVEGKSEE